jgi:hypothetical protein
MLTRIKMISLRFIYKKTDQFNPIEEHTAFFTAKDKENRDWPIEGNTQDGKNIIVLQKNKIEGTEMLPFALPFQENPYIPFEQHSIMQIKK